jgi:hypothetical protein
MSRFYTTLTDEIENDPLGIGYKHGNGVWKANSVILGLLTDTAHGDKHIKLSAQEIVSWMGDNGTFEAMCDDAKEAETTPSRSASMAIQALLNHPEALIDFSLVDVRSLFVSLKTNGIMTTGQHQSFMGLYQKPMSRAEELGVGGVQEGHIAQIRPPDPVSASASA